MVAIADRVREITTSTGTGAVTLGGAVPGYRAFATAFANGTQVYYCIAADPAVGSWEVGIGTLGAGTLTRNTVLASSSGGGAVAFSAGIKDVFVTAPASKLPLLDAAGDLTLIGSLTAALAFFGVTTMTGAQLNTATQATAAVGRFRWNATYGTAEMRLLGGNIDLHV
jgi:hypothetical protein